MARRAKAKSGVTKAPATAPGQTLGYGLQYTRLTAMLLEAPEGSACSMEVLGDVAEQSADGETTLAESKSALTDNPVADRAISLWKTLFNWLELVKSGFVDLEKTTFVLYVSRQVDGDLIRAFHDSHSSADAQGALARARDELWGEAPNYPQRGAMRDELSRYVTPVLIADENLLLPIIINLQLVCGSGSPQADIEALIRRHPVSEAKVPDIADKLCGWVKRNADKAFEKGLPAVILRDDFHREYVSYVRSVDRDLILKSWARIPSDAEKNERLFDMFVQQLDLIELSFDDKLQAISDFLRASSDRAAWSKAGDVHETSFDELDNNLRRAWLNISRAVGIEASSQAEVVRGQLVHVRCMSHTTNVQGMEPPGHFVPGCFHGLADDMVIGWHPTYRTLLGKAVGAVS